MTLMTLMTLIQTCFDYTYDTSPSALPCQKSALPSDAVTQMTEMTLFLLSQN